MNDERPASNKATNPETPENRFSERLGRFSRRGWLQRVLDWLYGYDYFISYKWSDGRIYALALAVQQLQKQGFDCFLDSEDYLKGDNWKSVGERALKRTTRLVLVGSPEVHHSEPVLRELKIFTATNKRVIPINFDDSLTGSESGASPLARYLDSDGIRIDEPMERLQAGPSPATIEELQESFKQQRQHQKRARALCVAAAVFVLLVTVAGLYARRSHIERTKAMVNVLTSDLIADDLAEDELTAKFSELREDMSARQGSIVSELKQRQADFQPAAEDENDRFAKQRAHAAILLVHFGEFELAKRFLMYSDGRPEPLAQFAARCKKPGGLNRQQVIQFAQYLLGDSSSSTDRLVALAGYSALLGVGEYLDGDRNAVPEEFLSQLKAWYCDHPSAAIHSACAWLLGPEAVAPLNKQLVAQLDPINLERTDKEWFVVKLAPEADAQLGDDDMVFITFVVFEDKQHRFAVSDREVTIGLCDQLGASDLYDYGPPWQNDNPANTVTFEDARVLCESFSSRLPKTLGAHLPNQSEWAFAWGNPGEDKNRRFQFGRRDTLSPRYGEFGRSERGVSRPAPVATYRPSTTGMFDMHGNVAEWTIELTGESPQGRIRGGAVGTDEPWPWNYSIGSPMHKGVRLFLSRVADHQPSPAEPSR